MEHGSAAVGSAGSPAWTPLLTGDGSWSLVAAAHGQACHSRSGAWQQARERYARPCRLRERAAELRGPLALLDVGTGLGLNLAAALAELDGTTAPLCATSLERDPAVIAAALALPLEPAELAPWWAIVRAALRSALDDSGRARAGVDLGGRGTLRLLLGDARASLPALAAERAFDAVFLDPFSPAVEGELWEGDFLRTVAQRMAEGALLSTYSCAFRVRLALARAGLVLGAGPRVGAKASGTLALKGAGNRVELEPLEARTARRIARRLAPAAIPGPEGVSTPGFA